MAPQNADNPANNSPLPRSVPAFRDIGGIRTSSGAAVRPGRLYRSGDLSRVDDAGLRKLRDLDIRLVCDLRSERERDMFPTRWPESDVPQWLHANIATDIRGGHDRLRILLGANSGTDSAQRMMIETYRLLPRAAGPVIAELIRRLAQDDVSTLVHCTAGKDRTGFVCSSLLLALGVSENVVREDYLRYNELIDLDRMAERSGTLLKHLLDETPSRPVLDLVNRVAIEYLDAAWQELRTRYGSFDAYLHAIGVSERDVEQLRAHLLDRAC